MKPEVGKAHLHKISHNSGNSTKPGYALAEVRSSLLSPSQDPPESLAAQDRRYPVSGRGGARIFTGARLLDDTGRAGAAGRGLAVGAASVAKADQLVGATGARVTP